MCFYSLITWYFRGYVRACVCVRACARMLVHVCTHAWAEKIVAPGKKKYSTKVTDSQRMVT